VAADPWRVELVRVGILPPTLMTDMLGRLERVSPWPVEASERLLEPGPAYDPVRQQYQAQVLLQMLTEPLPPPAVKRLGVTHVDLFLPVFSHLFGYALLEGAAGLVSLYRLRPEFSGDEPAPEVLVERLVREVLHELGHTFGLKHCPVSWCVMNPSRVPEEVDLRDDSYCEPCLRALPAALPAAGRGAAGLVGEPGEAGSGGQP
jgi:archaemetzincin